MSWCVTCFVHKLPHYLARLVQQFVSEITHTQCFLHETRCMGIPIHIVAGMNQNVWELRCRVPTACGHACLHVQTFPYWCNNLQWNSQIHADEQILSSLLGHDVPKPHHSLPGTVAQICGNSQWPLCAESMAHDLAIKMTDHSSRLGLMISKNPQLYRYIAM